MTKPACPPVKLDVREIVRSAKDEVLAELEQADHGRVAEAEGYTARVSGLGKLQLVPSAAEFSGVDFILGYSLIPPVVNLASKLSDEGILLPKIEKTLFRGVATGVTLIVQLATGKSFLLGSLIGQIPTTMDALADVAVDAIKAGQAPKAAPSAPAEQKGIGQTPEEEIEKLRRDLERAGVSGHLGQEEDEGDLGRNGAMEEEMAGYGVRGTMVVG